MAENERGTLRQAATTMGVILAVLWAVELIDTLTGHRLDYFGIHPRSLAGLLEIFTSPFLHYSWWHLLGNSVPLFVLGFIILLSGQRVFADATLVSVVCSGLFVWLVSPSRSVTLGASGVVFGYLVYILVRGFYTRRISHLLIALAVAAIYGGMLLGLLPLRIGISWQAHVGGALGGVAAAALTHRLDKADRSK
ncbi:rhomboid family intramembrane serine protease [Actinobaculum sp. 313]|uniref:rhomboid family intramembrane serine protease n=1 Tax=Actinobaculum sp. 313 TaxID=2495645 RepID=UPI00196A2EBC|nr:rhomboid family intramembrane serine protease [Actinobaculum sp. 313]